MARKFCTDEVLAMLDDDDDDGELEIDDPLEVIMEGSDEEFSDLEEFDDNEHENGKPNFKSDKKLYKHFILLERTTTELLSSLITKIQCIQRVIHTYTHIHYLKKSII